MVDSTKPCADCHANLRRDHSAYCEDCYKRKNAEWRKARRQRSKVGAPLASKLCARCRERQRETGKSYCVQCKADVFREANNRRRDRPLREYCARCAGIRTGKHHSYCVACQRLQRQEWLERNSTETPCARCGEVPREPNMSYCRPCHRALGKESRERTNGKIPLDECSRCEKPRTGKHPNYCLACVRVLKEARRLRPCADCGADRDPGDRASASYCYNCWRNRYVWRKFGITLAQYNDLLEQQNNCCAICYCEANGRAWHVDHCHETSRVRGILCDNCNTGLGKFKDDPVLIQRAAEYLLRSD